MASARMDHPTLGTSPAAGEANVVVKGAGALEATRPLSSSHTEASLTRSHPRPTEAGILSASLYFVTVLRATL